MGENCLAWIKDMKMVAPTRSGRCECAPLVLRMAVVSQSSVKFGKKRVLLVGETIFMSITTEVATSKFE